MMNKKLNLSLALLFVSIASFAQSKKLEKNFKLGVVDYNLYQTLSPSKGINDTVFFSLFKVGRSKLLLKEVKSITVKSTGEKLMSSNFSVDNKRIVFTQELPNGVSRLHIYTQGPNGLLSLQVSVAEVKKNAPPMVVEGRKQQVLINNDNNIYTKVDTEPEFPGGINAFRKYLANQTQSPEEKAKISGIIIIKFVVERDGSLSKIQTDRRLGNGYDEMLIEVLKKAPNWIPAKIESKAVRYQYRITFNLSE